MRIIENPNPQEETIVVCDKCGCKYAYNKGDVQSKNNGVMGPAYYCFHWVNCPNCGITHLISNKKPISGHFPNNKK